MARTVYDVYALEGDEIVKIALIDGDKVTGPGADGIREILESHKKGRHPNDPPDLVLSGGYVWAVKRMVPSGPA
jgi:hypothetical protein